MFRQRPRQPKPEPPAAEAGWETLATIHALQYVGTTAFEALVIAGNLYLLATDERVATLLATGSTASVLRLAVVANAAVGLGHFREHGKDEPPSTPIWRLFLSWLAALAYLLDALAAVAAAMVGGMIDTTTLVGAAPLVVAVPVLVLLLAASGTELGRLALAVRASRAREKKQE